MKGPAIFAQLIAVSLLGLAVYLHSPATGLGAVGIYAITVAETILATKRTNKEMVDLETQILTLTERVNQLQKEINRLVVRQSEY